MMSTTRHGLGAGMIEYEEVTPLPPSRLLPFCFPGSRGERFTRAKLQPHLMVAISFFPRHLGRPPDSIWLPLENEHLFAPRDFSTDELRQYLSTNARPKSAASNVSVTSYDSAASVDEARTRPSSGWPGQ